MKPCPRCNHAVQEDQAECPNCGVVFAKWNAAHPSSPASVSATGKFTPRYQKYLGLALVILSWVLLSFGGWIGVPTIAGVGWLLSGIGLALYAKGNGYSLKLGFLMGLLPYVGPLIGLFDFAGINKKESKSFEASPATGDGTRSPQRWKWIRISAVVLTSSKFYFLTILTVSLAIYVSMEKMGGEYVEPGVKPYDGMVVIAAVPDPAKQGAVQIVQVMLRDMEKFKTANPAQSFLLPPGSGRIGTDSEHSTNYNVQPMEDGKVLVETKRHQPIGGLLIMRYEATDKSVLPIFTNNVQWSVSCILGFMLASVLYFIGIVLEYWAGKHRGAP